MPTNSGGEFTSNKRVRFETAELHLALTMIIAAYEKIWGDLAEGTNSERTVPCREGNRSSL